VAVGNRSAASAPAPPTAASVTAPGADPRAHHLDAAGRARLDRAARDAALHYPNDPALQSAAIDAALEYLHGNTDLADAGADWDRARGEEQRVRARIRQIAIMAVADNISERSVARALGVDRMTLRRWSGKTGGRAPVEACGPGHGERR
jgi:Homeodomain-like domain